MKIIFERLQISNLTGPRRQSSLRDFYGRFLISVLSLFLDKDSSNYNLNGLRKFDDISEYIASLY